MLEPTILQTIWFVLWGVIWAIYFMLDGFDLGLGALMPFMTKSETEKKIAYSSMGPFWDGNEVWLITAGGVTFAAFPTVYAVMFSALYSALMLVLFCLIIRGISIEYRHKLESPRWKSFWDVCFCVSSGLAAILLGVAFANIFKGIPIDQEGVYHGTLFTLLNPYGIAGGLLFLFLFLVHGAVWQAVKSEGELNQRALATAKGLWPILLVVAVTFLVFTFFATDLYDNYLKNPVLMLIPIACVAGLLLTRVFLSKGDAWKSWFASSLTIVGATLFGVVGLYPKLLPSSMSPEFHLLASDSSSSPLTLKIMLGVVLVFVPVVIGYQIWVYRMFSDKVTEEALASGEGY